MKPILALLFLFFLNCNLASQIYPPIIGCGDSNPNAISKCYKKCFYPHKYEIEELSFPIYTGEYFDSLDFVIKHEIELSNNVKKVINVVTNQKLTNEFIWETYHVKSIILKRGYNEWTEVVCSNKINEEISLKLSQALHIRGYLNVEKVDNKLDDSDIIALENFQRDNDLPVGHLDIETVYFLGLNEVITESDWTSNVNK